MGLSRRQFTQEFKLAPVRRLEQGISIAEVARGLERAAPPELFRVLSKSKQFSRTHGAILLAMRKTSAKRILAIPCPTCGAKPGEQCELHSGQPRNAPHRDRRLTAKERIGTARTPKAVTRS
jgi:hypothetical protein